MATSGAKTGSRTEHEGTLQARDFVRVGWRVVTRAPLTVLWRILGDVGALLLRPIALVWFLVIATVGTVASAGAGAGMNDVVAAWSSVDPGRFWGGVAGFVAVFWLVSFVLEATVSGGIFETLSKGVRGREVGGSGQLFAAVGEGFPKIVRLRFVEAALQLATTLLGATTFIAIAYGFSRGGFDTVGTTAKVLLIAVPAFLYFSFLLLVRVTMRVAAAPLFLEECTTGEAIADAAAFVLARLAGIYRVLAVVAGALLAPLVAYWLLLIVSASVGMDSAFGPLFDALQIVGQIVLFASFGALSVLFDSSMFALYAEDSGMIRIRPSTDGAKGEATDEGKRGASRGPYDRTTRLDDLLPESVERIYDVREIPGFGRRADESEMDSTDEDEG